MQNVIKKMINKQEEFENDANFLSSNLYREKILALYVEIGELANEWQGFKYWYQNRLFYREKALEEYVDGLKFLFSIGLDIGFDIDLLLFPKTDFTGDKNQITDTFNELYRNFSRYLLEEEIMTDTNWESVINRYFYLGALLGFDLEEIYAAFVEKTKINYSRLQEDGWEKTATAAKR